MKTKQIESRNTNLDSIALHKKEPNLSENIKYALYAPTGAIVCPYELCIVAYGNAMDNGAELKCNFEVTEITENDGIYSIFQSGKCL